MASRGWMLCGPTTHIVPLSLTRHPQGPFLGVGLCSSVFLPLHNLGSPQADSEAPGHAPTREMADLIRGDPLSRRPQLFFLLAWALLAHHVFLARRNIPLELACWQGPRSILNLPVVGGNDHGVASRPPSLCLLPDSPGPSQPQADTEAPKQLCVGEAVMSSLCKCHLVNYVIA